MKKILAVLLTFVVLGTVLIACSKTEDDKNTTKLNEEIVTEDAKIKQGDAIDFISTQYTEEELGLADIDKNYQFMIASTGVEIDGQNYVKVVANVPIKNDTTNENGQETYTIETYGEYFISFDGKTVLMRDRKTGDYKELENRYTEYSKQNDSASKSKAD